MAKYNGYTSIGGAGGGFPATRWTLILDPSQKQAILTEMGEKYWKPLYCYLRGLGFGNEQAKELVQGFFVEKIIDRELLQQADRTRGRLRTFLLTAIRNYAINVLRKEHPAAELDETAPDSRRHTDPVAAFDRAWADELLRDVLRELQSECLERGKSVHWQLFRDWLLEPAADDEKPTMADFCRKYGIADAAQAYHMIENVKRRFRSIMREQLRLQVGSESDIDLEIADLLNVFSADGARF